MPEPTATNPQTGEKLVYRGGQWVPMGGAAMPSAPAAPGVIPGRPRTPPPITPIQAANLENAEESLALRRKADARAEAAAAQGTESERTAGFLAGRVVDAVGRLSGGVQEDASSASPTLGVEAARGVFGDAAANYLTDDQRQVVRAAQIDILDAALTLGTGAAYNKEQLEGYREAYFPQLGDSEAAITSKREALRSLLVNARTKAGRAAPDIDRALAALDALDRPAPAPASGGGGEEWTREKSVALWGREYVTEDGKPLGPDGGYAQDKETGEWGMVGRTTADSPRPTNLGPDGQPRITGNDPAYAQVAAGVGDIVQGGLNNTIGLLANPINTNLFRAFGYDNYTSDIGATAREGLGLPYGNETIGAINQAASGGFSAASGVNALARNVAPGLARNAMVEYGSRPLLDMATGGSAAASGEAARQMGFGPVGQTVATVAGGGTPSAAMVGRNALLRGASPPPDFDPSVVRAGERQGVPIRQPDALPSKRGDTAALETSQRGGPIIQQARAQDNARIEQRVGEVGGEGAASDPYALGGRVRGAGQRTIDRTRGEKNERYLRAEVLANGQRVDPAQARAAVERNIAELEAQGENTNSAVLTYLRGLRDDLNKSDGFSITEFQGLRSAASKKIRGDNALTVSDADRRTEEVVTAFTADASEQLPEASSRALADADAYYARRQNFIKEVLQPLMGTQGRPVPAERAAERLLAMTRGKGDYDNFSRMWGELSVSEQADVAATLAQSLGRKANGDFSPATLIRSLDPRTGINPRTARLIFGKEGAEALNDLRAISQAKTDTANALNNSRTGTVVNRAVGGLKTLVLSTLGFQAGGVGGAVAAPVAREFIAKWGEERAARTLMNPVFTKWLREAPEATDPRAIDGYFRRLETQAAKSAVLAGDVQALREALRESFAQSPGRLAATEQEQN